MRYILSFILVCSFVSIIVGQNKSNVIGRELINADSAVIKSEINSADSINISQIVAEQINAVRQKQLEKTGKGNPDSELKITPNPTESKTTTPDWWSDILETSIRPFIDKIFNSIISLSDVTIKIFSLGVASIFIFSFVFIRRRTIKRKTGEKDPLKNNIRLLREERPVKRTDIKLKGTRNSLIRNALIFNEPQKNISKVAKEMSIAKGEVLLASKIKSYELNKNLLSGSFKNMNWRIF